MVASSLTVRQPLRSWSWNLLTITFRFSGVQVRRFTDRLELKINCLKAWIDRAHHHSVRVQRVGTNFDALD